MAISLIMISLTRDSEEDRWENQGRWSFVYGRRKTGKTFFVRNFTDWDSYFFIGRGGDIFEGDDKIGYETFSREVFRLLKEGGTVVVDEIQRLPEEFYDRLHKEGVQGELVAVSSTLWTGRKLMGEKSPLLGLFSEFKVGLVDERDILRNLQEYIDDPKELVETAVYLREPWLVPVWESADDFLLSLASNTKITVPALIGEIFTEEDRELSEVYEGVLKAIADGKRTSNEITGYLHSLKTISSHNPSLVHPYLKTLKKIGLLEKVKFHGRNKHQYRHASPVTDLYYYLSEKYGFAERDLPDDQIRGVINEKLPMHVEQFFQSLMESIFGYSKEVIVEDDYEIDIVLKDFDEIKVLGEVKWQEKVTEGDIERVEEVMSDFSCQKILLVPSEGVMEDRTSELEVWTVEDVLERI